MKTLSRNLVPVSNLKLSMVTEEATLEETL